MKKIFVLTLALFTMLALSALAQESGKTTTTKTKSTSTTTMKKAGASKKLTGTIGQDGKTFTNDADQSSWTISNPDKVKGHEGHHVTLRGKTDDAAKTIDVTSVTMVSAKSGKSGKSGKSKKSGATSPTGK